GQSGPSLACPAPSSIPAPTPSPSAQAMYLQKLQESSEAIKAGNFRRAIQLYTESIGLDPENHILYTNRAAAYLKNSQPEKALEDAIRARSICPKWGKDKPFTALTTFEQEEIFNRKYQQFARAFCFPLPPHSSARQTAAVAKEDLTQKGSSSSKTNRHSHSFWVNTPLLVKLSSVQTNPLLKAGINLASSCWRCGGISCPQHLCAPSFHGCTSRGEGRDYWRRSLPLADVLPPSPTQPHPPYTYIQTPTNSPGHISVNGHPLFLLGTTEMFALAYQHVMPNPESWHLPSKLDLTSLNVS
ncbi:hypothetical protein RRG08_042333, partial [Elysia crispata]